MENVLPKNRPSRRESVRVSRLQFDHIFTDSAAAKGEQIARDLAALKDDIAPAADKRFVLFKNKFLWFDRDVAGLFPRMEKDDLPVFRCDQGSAARAYSDTREGFTFVTMTGAEVERTFRKDVGNPYMKSDGFFLFYQSGATWNNHVIANEGGSYCNSGCAWRDVPAQNWRSYCGSRSCGDKAMLVPIHRLRGKNAAAMNYFDSFFTWIQLGLVPEGLKPKHERLFENFIRDYSKIEEYVSFDDAKNIVFDGDRFKADVLAGRFTEKVFDYDFNIRETLDCVMSGQRKYTGSVAALKRELLDCDHKRADLEPYDERLLTDVNRGHWELFENAPEGTAEVQLPEGEMLVARPPQLDVCLNGIVAIDFGTKSTIVVCRDGEPRMLRVGKGDYSKAPTPADFENPTAIHLRDAEKFLTAYRARDGRPFTEWNQVTVSHQAANAIFAENVGSSVYNSVFSELKQWAKDEQSYPVLKDLQGFTQEILPYLETKPIDANNFDPIELYAYYLGLYINNMHGKIYLDYILSYPVNYRKDIRERIRKSFECGLKKSLPPALLADEEIMKRFRVYLGASEPAAYAISALEGFGLEPETLDEKVAYGVFDFGGGTTDFDFGIETVPENHTRNFIIEQFGFNGDLTLGGENILELLAYEVYKDNIDVMRREKIPFALPADCEIFAGAETLVTTTKGAAAHMNTRKLSEALRPIWENTAERTKLTESPLDIVLFSSEQKDGGNYTVGVNLKIDAGKLDRCIEERIRVGVVNFFQSLKSAFKGREVYPVHIFLAGNSCRSHVVKKLFDEFIANEAADKFVLHMPLGEENFAAVAKVTEEELAALKESADVPDEISAQTFDANLDRRRTGKTGVAFGLLRCRRGGKDVKIVDKNVDAGGEMIFPYFLGDAGADGNTFTVQIGRDVGYGQWVYFTVADEPEFEIYYTTAPRSLQNKMPVAQVSMAHCVFDEDEASDDDNYGVYVRKVSPNEIEYAVGTAEDFDGDFGGKIYRQKL